MLYSCILPKDVHQKMPEASLCHICCLFKPPVLPTEPNNAVGGCKVQMMLSWLESYQVLWVSMPAVVGNVDGSVVMWVNSAD